MPELPEVETVRRGLIKLIIGKTIESVEHDWPKSFPNSQPDVDSFLVGAGITNVRRRAKILIIDLSTDYSLVIHLKMTGQMVFVPSAETSRRSKVEGFEDERFGAGHPNDSLLKELPDNSTRVIIMFNDKSHLYFNDQRKFGWVRLLPTYELEKREFLSKLGPEPLEPEFTYDVFHLGLMRRKRSNIKAVLLDQTTLSGVGNIYADESLWGAMIHPATLVEDITKLKLKKLHNEIIYVLNLSIDKGGSTSRNYVNAEGKKGSYLEFAKVFRRENLPCPRCGTTIEKIRVAGRGTHFCPKCQKI
jgi:formamidopyrimidine-DNA glycosylase